ncbi:hypothetical protein AX16_003587 [Volvariella volvacea WC 439]|nr:hypothetical protein AX16_003587 [Volvariella volvacea WC 439]
MSHPTGPAHNVSYDPLPLTNDDHTRALYNAPPSPDPNSSSFNTPLMQPSDPSGLPTGAATPRFQGAALYNDPTAPYARDSIASGNTGQNSEYTSSVYALNDTPGTAPLSAYRDNPQDSHFANEQDAHAMATLGQSNRYMGEKNAAYTAPRSKSRRKILILAAIISLILIILAIVIPVYFAIVRPRSNSGNARDENSNSNSGSESSARPTSTGTPDAPQNAIVTGGDGSEVTMDDGTTFTYRNSFGGYWYWDENDPFNNGARPQSWSPALNETFRYGIDNIRGVNLGGWLNIEPFISPALFERYADLPNPPIDEWELCEAMAADTENGGLAQLEEHYRTFITERDFADIAAAGLNYIRIPIGFWAIDTWEGEPYLPRVSWEYFLKAIKWARKYGLRINLDLHALPGSQNGWNHSGRLGTINFLNGPMGYANAQRALDYIRVLAEFISQPQYQDVITMFGIINEPQAPVMGQDALARFYMEAYTMIREITGIGEGNGAYISFHDGFLPRDQWVDFIPNADRITLDTHPYMCFGPQSADPMTAFVDRPCTAWAAAVNNSMATFGLVNAGEYSNAVNDCGLFLNGVGLGTRYEGDFEDGQTWPRRGSCEDWTDYQNYTPATKAAILQFALASMDALQNYFFWTWRIGPSLRTGKVETPAWSYSLGLQEGWMPADPRDATGVCGNTSPWTPPLQPWQTGGAGAGDVPAEATARLAWPPASLSAAGAVTLLPSYTTTGAIPTLPVPTYVNSDGETIDAGNGWANPSDTRGVAVPIPSCSYLDPWVGPTGVPPSPLCSGAARRDLEARDPFITPAPVA